VQIKAKSCSLASTARMQGQVEAEASAIAVMRRTATEWLAIELSPAAVDIYLDRWFHEECGYRRT
jgi:hypothetical protein